MPTMRVLGLFLLCAVAVNAQTNKGGIKGTVSDANGAAVPGATVTITNLSTNQAVKVTTSETGAFSASSLEPVSYSVVVERLGFKKAIVEKVKVDTASTATANVTLETGAVAETVTVTADAPDQYRVRHDDADRDRKTNTGRAASQPQRTRPRSYSPERERRCRQRRPRSNVGPTRAGF